MRNSPYQAHSRPLIYPYAMASILTAVDAVEKVIQVWNKIQERIKQQEAAEALAADLSEFGLERRRVALQTNIEIAQRVARDLSAPEDRRKDLGTQYRRVYQQLLDIQEGIEDVVKNKNRGSVVKYLHTNPNKKLAKTVEEYQAAFRDFDEAVIRADAVARHDPYWLIQPGEMKVVGNPPAVTAVTTGISCARVSYTPPGAKESAAIDVLWETLPSSDSTWDENDRDMRILAAGLSTALPHWHIPKLRGYERNKGLKWMRLVFEHPDPTRALCTLSSAYAAARNNPPSLALRVRLCYQLALAVLHAHKPRINVVHKHIRPGNLLLAVPKTWKDPNQSGGELVVPPNWRGDKAANPTGTVGSSPGAVDLFLSGWQNARTTAQATTYVGESAAHRVMYQHPQRHETSTATTEQQANPAQPATPVEKYNIGHDIYSLGVCMLELLTWDTLVFLDPKKRQGQLRLSGAYLAAFRRLGFDAGMAISEDDDLAALFTQDAGHVKETLVEVAETGVPPRAGDRLAGLVCRCLTCLDPVPMYGGTRFRGGGDGEGVAEAFSREIFDDLSKVLGALEVASAGAGDR